KNDSSVTVSWRQGDDELLLAVEDEGIGIDALHIPRLTERFYRVDDSRSSATGGTGLGLAIVKHIAAGHRAELRITSILGKGSTFTLAFRR
ncbi:MAG TPA: PAS domain-containing sensor histidine kinase, partial [Halieaceae bacterium]|nr:PAS domain-containing sensor histidine kinase [Halieaceae bacterium]